LGSRYPCEQLGVRPLHCCSRQAAQRPTLFDDEGEAYERFADEPGGFDSRRTGRSHDQEDVAQPVDDRWYDGVIKSYAKTTGFGFVANEEIANEYSYDIFLHKAEADRAFPMGTPYAGDKVRFQIMINEKGQPQAKNVERRDGKMEGTQSSDKTFVGRVKSYYPKQGFGFIECDETSSIYNSDIFLHKNQAEEASVEKGNMVTFSVQVMNGKPQAREVVRFGSAASKEDASWL